MARKKGKKPNRAKLLTKFSKGGFSKKEVKKLSKRLGINTKKAAKITSRFTRKQNKTANNRFNLNINKTTNFDRSSPNKSPLKVNSNPPPQPAPTPTPTPLTVPEQIKAEAPNVSEPETPTKTETSYNNNEALIQKLMGEYDNSAYMKQINDLQSTISGLETTVGGYQTELNTLGDQYKDMDLEQAQFKAGDSQYLSGNNSRGVRLRRSKNKNLFALGTGQFNRKNRSKNLAIGNVNL